MDDDLARERTLTQPIPPDAPVPAAPPAASEPAAPPEASEPVPHAADQGPVAPRDPADPPASSDVSAGPGGPPANGTGATGSQLRRFIKSRPWVPMHELRRRFGIEGTEDEMAGVDVGGARIYVGLPPREAALLADLIRQGEVGYELVHDPDCPAVAGVYPMRPVVRT